MNNFNLKINQNDKFDESLSRMICLLSDGQREWRRIRNSLDELTEHYRRLTDKVCQLEDWSRKPFTKATVKTYLDVVHRYYNGTCPCCSERAILNDAGVKLDELEIDHFKGPKWNKITEGWPICKQCHQRLTHGYLSRDGWVYQAFQAFQMRVAQYTHAEDKQLQLF